MTIDQAADLIFKAGTDPLPEWLASKPQEEIDAFCANARINARKQATNLIAAIEQRDAKGLQVLAWRENKASAATFTAMTNVQLPANLADRTAALRQYCGPETWDVYHHAEQAARDAERDKRTQEAAERAMQAALRHPVRWTFDDYSEPRSGTVKDLIDACLDHGYRVFTPRKHGAFTDYQLGDGRAGYIFRKKLEIEYIRARLAELNAV